MLTDNLHKLFGFLEMPDLDDEVFEPVTVLIGQTEDVRAEVNYNWDHFWGQSGAENVRNNMIGLDFDWNVP